jgi:hypothetical protein
VRTHAPYVPRNFAKLQVFGFCCCSVSCQLLGPRPSAFFFGWLADSPVLLFVFFGLKKLVFNQRVPHGSQNGEPRVPDLRAEHTNTYKFDLAQREIQCLSALPALNYIFVVKQLPGDTGDTI